MAGMSISYQTVSGTILFMDKLLHQLLLLQDFYDVNDLDKLISISSYMIQIQRSQWEKKSGTPPQNMQSSQGVL